MVYLIYGEQYPIVLKRTKKLVKQILNDEIDEFSYVKMNAKVDLVEDIVKECTLLPFLGNKVVQVDNPYFLSNEREKVSFDKDQDFTSLVNYILNDKEDNSVTLIFVLERASVNKKNEIYKAIEKNGKIIFEEKLDASSLRVTGKKFFEKKGANITSEALEELILRTNDDLSLFINETDKLSLYTKNVTLKDVELLVPSPLENNAFNIVEALLNNKINVALKTFRDLISLKEDPTRLLYLFYSQFKTYLIICYLYKEERKSLDEIGNILKPMNIYRIKIITRNLYSISYKELQNIIDYLYLLDTKLKAMEIEPITGTELFMINFNEIRKGVKEY